jgi:7-cyano-7-deazaguanine synthase
MLSTPRGRVPRSACEVLNGVLWMRALRRNLGRVCPTDFRHTKPAIAVPSNGSKTVGCGKSWKSRQPLECSRRCDTGIDEAFLSKYAAKKNAPCGCTANRTTRNVSNKALVIAVSLGCVCFRGRVEVIQSQMNKEETKRKAIVLLSGGLDSATTLAIARCEGYEIHALSFRYGQRHAIELEGAKQIAKTFNVEEHIIIDIDLRIFGGSALTDDIDVPKDRGAEEMEQGIPITYVPARNTIFLSFALAFAEVKNCEDIFIGVNAVDYSGYPDCRPEYIEAFTKMANLATKAGVEGKQKIKIHAPLIHLTKAEIIKRGLELNVDYSLTRSCYDPNERGESCGYCDSCLLRLKGFRENGVEDPAPYQVRGALVKKESVPRASRVTGS